MSIPSRITLSLMHLWRLISRNWRSKGLALLLALLAWLYAYRGDVRETKKIKAPISLDLPEGLALVECPVTSVTLALRGTRWELDQVQEDSVDVRVAINPPLDVERVKTRTSRISESDVKGLPSNVAVEEISPRDFSVTFDKRDRKLLPVKVVIQGEPEKGFRLVGEPEVFPNRVLVTGPSSVLRNVPFIETVPVNVYGLAREQWYQYRPVKIGQYVVDPATARRVPVSTEQDVSVEVRVSRDYEEKVVSLEVLVAAPPDFPYRLQLLEKTIDIRLKAPRGAMTPEALERVAAFVDASSFEPKAPLKTNVRLFLPDGFILAQDGIPQVTIDKITER